MDTQQGESLKDVFEGLRDKFKREHGLLLRFQSVTRKNSDLWEVTLQTQDRVRVYKGEGNSQKEALVDAFNKARQALA